VIRDVRDNGPVERAFRFGPAEPGWLPLAGDWNGDDIDGIGLYKDGVFLLRQTASDGPPEMTFRYGASEPGWRPVAGDWNGSSNSTVGLYKEGLWLLSNTLPAIADVRPIRFGRAGWTPVVGDWDQNGTTTIGVFRAGVWELSNVNAGISPDTIYSNGIREEGWQPLTNYQGSHAALQLLGSTPHNPLSSPTPTSSPVAQMTEPGTETPTEASKPEDGTLTTTPTKVELTEEVLATADPSPMPILPSETPSVLTTLTTTVPPDTTAVPTATTEPSTMTPVMASEVEG
jgi:hypothetical protein